MRDTPAPHAKRAYASGGCPGFQPTPGRNPGRLPRYLGCQSWIRLPSGSSVWANQPFGYSSGSTSTSQPAARSLGDHGIEVVDAEVHHPGVLRRPNHLRVQVGTERRRSPPPARPRPPPRNHAERLSRRELLRTNAASPPDLVSRRRPPNTSHAFHGQHISSVLPATVAGLRGDRTRSGGSPRSHLALSQNVPVKQ